MRQIREMKTKDIKKELERSDAVFWAWQADGPKPAYDVEAYAVELSEELKNRGHDEG